MSFSSDKKATVSLVTSSSPGNDGEILGETPVTIEAEKLAGKVVKVWGKDVVPQYWILDELESGETKINLKLENKPDQGGENAGSGDANLKYRLVMKAYKALADRDWKLARDLAAELGKLDGKVAAPHLIAGIAYLREGRKAEAKSAFEKAKTLDPEDHDIDKLIQVAK